MKIEFSSQRRETVLFLTTNMAAVTSRANQQFPTYLRIKDLEFYLCSSLLPFILTFDRLAVASLTREITVRTAAPMLSIVKLENRFIQKLKVMAGQPKQRQRV